MMSPEEIQAAADAIEDRKKPTRAEGTTPRRIRSSIRESVAEGLSVIVAKEKDRFVKNQATLGMYAAVVLPTFGFTIIARAPIAADVVAEYAMKDRRVLAAMQGFNAFFDGSKLLEVALSYAAAIAVDTGRITPDLAIEIGPFKGDNALRPVQMVIGDVLETMAENMPAAPTEPPVPPSGDSLPNGRVKGSRGRRAAPVATVEGGIEST